MAIAPRTKIIAITTEVFKRDQNIAMGTHALEFFSRNNQSELNDFPRTLINA